LSKGCNSITRASFLVFHRWIGLILGPFLLLQVLTCAFLVLNELPSANHAPPRTIAVGALLASAHDALPGYRVTRIYMPSGGGKAFAELADGTGAALYAEIDPAHAPIQTNVVRSGSLWRFPYRAAIQWHYRLASGTTGMFVVLATGCALALTVVCGFLFWWPGWGRLGQALKPRDNLPTRLRMRRWHRSLGALTALLALFSAMSGVMLILPDITAAPPSRPWIAFAQANPVQVEAALSAAQARFPDAAPRDIRFPPADRIDINFHAPERNARAVHVVSARLSDGAVMKIIPAGANPVLWMKVLPLHTGQSFGLIGLLLLLAEAGALVFLVWAGTRMWLDKRRIAK
jgi:uncharacterized iron-regulated membrane protein